MLLGLGRKRLYHKSIVVTCKHILSGAGRKEMGKLDIKTECEEHSTMT